VPVHHAIRAHTQELCLNDQTLQILSAAFASEGNCGGRRRLLFFLKSALVFEMPISGGSAKRLWFLFFGAYCIVFFRGNSNSDPKTRGSKMRSAAAKIIKNISPEPPLRAAYKKVTSKILASALNFYLAAFRFLDYYFEWPNQPVIVINL
jgi:hypothetical protein